MSKRWLKYTQDWTFWTRNGRTGVDRIKDEHRFVTLAEFDEAIAKKVAVESSATAAAAARGEVIPGVMRPHKAASEEVLPGHFNEPGADPEAEAIIVDPVVPVEVQTAESTEPKKRTPLQKAVARKRARGKG